MVAKSINKASLGKYRVIGYDKYDYNEYFIKEYSNIYQALFLVWRKSRKSNATPTSFSDIYFIYNDKGEMLYKGTFDEGIKKQTN